MGGPGFVGEGSEAQERRAKGPRVVGAGFEAWFVWLPSPLCLRKAMQDAEAGGDGAAGPAARAVLWGRSWETMMRNSAVLGEASR